MIACEGFETMVEEERKPWTQKNRGHEMCVSPFLKVLYGGWLVGWVEVVKTRRGVERRKRRSTN